MTRIAMAIVAVLVITVLSLLLQNTRLSEQASIAIREAEALRTSIERTKEAMTADRALMQAQFKTIEAFDRKLKEMKAYVAALPDRDRGCLSPDDADQLRSLWAE